MKSCELLMEEDAIFDRGLRCEPRCRFRTARLTMAPHWSADVL